MYQYLKENLHFLMQRHGFNPTSLARQTKISKTAIRNILSGSSEKQRKSTLEELSAVFNISIEDLVTKQLFSKISAHKIPLLKRSQISLWLNDDPSLTIENEVVTDRKVSDKAFAITANESTGLLFMLGSHLIFDPAYPANEGSYVLVQLSDENNAIYIKQLMICVGEKYIKTIISRLSNAITNDSKLRDSDRIIATLIQTQNNFEID